MRNFFLALMLLWSVGLQAGKLKFPAGRCECHGRESTGHGARSLAKSQSRSPTARL